MSDKPSILLRLTPDERAALERLAAREGARRESPISTTAYALDLVRTAIREEATSLREARSDA